ncbi:glycoside hydrolase family 6 protein [Modestobacter italicus]|uniref:glycoside hydrolase family 6 protein n=1 Tax=Modestobacter italicus (strain DSM 44449 / CECT 9708 / BC 501) TaxID=2732864 RepID=UPI001C94D703|nr:glycoside hydrolase family 6 protein [Modestobacter italicus]
MFSTPRRRRASLLAVSAVIAVGPLGLAGPAAAAPPVAEAPAPAAPLAPDTRFTTPVPDPGAVRQTIDLARQQRFGDAELIAREAATPQAIWFTDGTPKEVRQEVRRASALAAATRSVPTYVVYNVPGRDCSQYSSGGAADDAAYRAWVDGFAAGLRKGQQITVVIEPDGLALMPGDCPPGTYPEGTAPTDEGRLADITYAAAAIERANPAALVYLDAGHVGWHAVGDIAERLDAAQVEQFQGFALNVSNYQYTANLQQYGTWISSCLTLITVTALPSSECGSQYWSGGPANDFQGVALDPLQQWSDTAADPTANTAGVNSRYDQQLGELEPTAHFVVDTSRNGRGPWVPDTTYPDPQTWCNPPARGLGPRPDAQPAAEFPLLDAYLWVKTPGQSDGQCNRGIAGSATDPEWGGIVDPAAGAWFPEQALELAQLAVPPLR